MPMDKLFANHVVEYIKDNTNHRKLIPLKEGSGVLSDYPDKFIKVEPYEPLKVMVVNYDSPYEAVDCLLPPDRVQEPNPTTRNPVRTLTWVHKA